MPESLLVSCNVNCPLNLPLFTTFKTSSINSLFVVMSNTPADLVDLNTFFAKFNTCFILAPSRSCTKVLWPISLMSLALVSYTSCIIASIYII